MAEKKFERDSVRKAEGEGWMVKKITTPGRRGAFDRLFIKEGKHVWIEFKNPNETGEPSELQLGEWANLIEHGADAHFIDDYAQFKSALGIMT